MNTNLISNDVELQQILWACYKCWQAGTDLPSDRDICYKWVKTPYEERFGAMFNQSRLRYLAKIGFLLADDSTRGGSRRYYKIAEPEKLAVVLREWEVHWRSQRPALS